MINFSLPELLIVAAIAILGAATLVAGVSWLGLAGGAPRKSARHADTPASPTFLIDGDDIIDACPEACKMIIGAPAHLSGRQVIEQLFRHHFPTLGQEMDALQPNRPTQLFETGNAGRWIALRKSADKIRLTLHLADDSADSVARAALTTELDFLRTVAEESPQQIWQQDAKGNVIWANRAYLNLSDRVLHGAPNRQHPWPDRPIFDDLQFDICASKTHLRRRSVTLSDKNAEEWFDVASRRLADTSLHYATSANSAVAAEQAHKTLLQTFGRTFASLSTGLAIFNDKRELSIFNPALIDLTGMSFDFLSARPTIDRFLDQLRDDRILPEPKNYASFKDQFIALENAALNGKYCENWLLPDGLTYRVTGKPQGDDAFAFFFEDISAEVSMARRFRSEIETGQTVLDVLPDALCVFSSTGVLLMSNKVYDDLWDMKTFGLMGRQDIRSELAVWQKKCAATPEWRALRDFITKRDGCSTWKGSMFLDDGRQLECVARPISGGNALISFTTPKMASRQIEVLTQKDAALAQRK